MIALLCFRNGFCFKIFKVCRRRQSRTFHGFGVDLQFVTSVTVRLLKVKVMILLMMTPCLLYDGLITAVTGYNSGILPQEGKSDHG